MATALIDGANFLNSFIQLYTNDVGAIINDFFSLLDNIKAIV
ncbi:hypothetical protein SDC9_160268 [bioreactor metagenome]|uniref:Uncharacterized protein n=1 Tax=bioreactor metagenome TaxID=1076179 RepID=A0A645FEX3_9ZZZZ